MDLKSRGTFAARQPVEEKMVTARESQTGWSRLPATLVVPAGFRLFLTVLLAGGSPQL